MPDMLELLSSHKLLSEVPRPQLEWLLKESEIVTLDSGYIFRAGESIDHLYILLSGELRTYAVQQNQQKEVLRLGAGGITGQLPFSRMKASPVFAEVL